MTEGIFYALIIRMFSLNEGEGNKLFDFVKRVSELKSKGGFIGIVPVNIAQPVSIWTVVESGKASVSKTGSLR